MGAIFDELLHAALRVEIRDDLFCYFDTSDDTFFFHNQLLASHLCLRNAAERCMVAITDVFFKPDGDEFLQFFCIHSVIIFARYDFLYLLCR